ncbi:MAG: hypothetical protein Q9159_000920 [Coniocarpon cinnabarinum]
MEAVEKAKRLSTSLKSPDKHQSETHAQDEVQDTFQSPAFSTGTFAQNGNTQQPKQRRFVDGVKKTARAVAHPREAAKSHATSKVIANERPWLNNQADADEEYLEAHDVRDATVNKLRRKTQDPNGVEPAQEELQDAVAQQQKTLDQVEEERLQLQVGWHMSRYVNRARIVQRSSLAFPKKSLYEERDAQGRYIRTDWGRWIGHLVFWSCQDCSMHYVDPTNEVPYDREVLVNQIERLLVASEVFQLWWMRVRKVYTWEDPWLTARWLLLYLSLLKTGYFMSFYWGYLLYSAVTNRTGRHTRRWMQESHERTHLAHERASMLSELVLRHGKEDWLEPLLDEFGPWIQLQVSDMADFLESAASYYDWRNVTSTTSTCIAYAALFLVSAIPRLEYSIKIFWFACGLYYFLSRPISTNFPRWRRSVDPIRWINDIPTPNADEEPSESDDEFFEDARETHSPDSDEHTSAERFDDDSRPTITSFSARWKGQSGTLELSPATIRFTSSSKLSKQSSVHWERPWSDMLEVRKTKRPSPAGSRRPPYALTILWRDHFLKQRLPGEERLKADPEHLDELYGMQITARNDAFNAVVGISGLWWMEVRPDPKAQDRMH